ncbi:hypothetical protein ACFZAE_14040 [Streptomyces scabiei]|uniref:hypothetical protein n=1 Tax=Streptomyces TaxID=1883 RepID=UPI002044E3FC
MLTATAAGTLLGALWFVPSANATQDEAAIRDRTATNASTTTETTTSETRELADTGSPNTTPYVIGGTAMLGVGAGFLAYAIRREREDFGPVRGV